MGRKTLLRVPVHDEPGHACEALFEDRGTIDEAVGERGELQRGDDPVLRFTDVRHGSSLRWGEARMDMTRQTARRLARHGLLVALLEAPDEVGGEGEEVLRVVGAHDVASQSDE